MTFANVILALVCLMSGTLLVAQEAKVTQLLSKDLTSLPGKEGLMDAKSASTAMPKRAKP